MLSAFLLAQQLDGAREYNDENAAVDEVLPQNEVQQAPLLTWRGPTITELVNAAAPESRSEGMWWHQPASGTGTQPTPADEAPKAEGAVPLSLFTVEPTRYRGGGTMRTFAQVEESLRAAGDTSYQSALDAFTSEVLSASDDELTFEGTEARLRASGNTTYADAVNEYELVQRIAATRPDASASMGRSRNPAQPFLLGNVPAIQQPAALLGMHGDDTARIDPAVSAAPSSLPSWWPLAAALAVAALFA